VAPQETVRQVPGGAGLSAAEVRLLGTMPLHAITAVYGEAGLRGRLLAEAGRFPGAQRARIEDALALMSRLHERDRRQREPYACHPMRVTIRILSHYRVTDADMARPCCTTRSKTLDGRHGVFRDRAFGVLARVNCSGLFLLSRVSFPFDPANRKYRGSRGAANRSGSS
jgi:hypothetical protein